MDRVSSLLPKVLRKRGIASQIHVSLLLHAMRRLIKGLVRLRTSH